MAVVLVAGKGKSAYVVKTLALSSLLHTHMLDGKGHEKWSRLPRREQHGSQRRHTLNCFTLQAVRNALTITDLNAMNEYSESV